MSPELTALMALQALDAASETLRKRLAELPGAEQAIVAALAAASAAVEAVKARIHDNAQSRRALEKEVAVVDTRLARFDEHKAAVKTNVEYTALLHEIATAKSEKDAVEDRLLVLMEEADELAAELKSAERALAREQANAEQTRAALHTERESIDGEFARLAGKRPDAAAAADPKALALYDQLYKARRGVALAQMNGDICGACHVRLRPHVAQMVRRNDTIVQCDSCQRILYFVPPAASSQAS